MDTQNLELLMERLITVNEKVLSELTEIKSELSDLKEEFNWVGEHTYGKVVYDGINEIASKLDSIEFNTSNI
jgi:hypothetical protein